MPRVRIDGGRRQTAHIWYTSAPAATAKKSGCRRWSQKRQPALIKETKPSPARTCGSTHQLGVSRAATILSMPARLGSPGNEISSPLQLTIRLEFRLVNSCQCVGKHWVAYRPGVPGEFVRSRGSGRLIKPATMFLPTIYLDQGPDNSRA
jgi:hypothetical protein